MNSFQDFTVIDLETTGLDPSVCEIIELGAARYQNGKLVETYSQLVRPSQPIPPEITGLTGIDDATVSAAPAIDSVFPDFRTYLDMSPWIVGHNVNFDLGFIRKLHEKKSMEAIERKALDTGVLARILYPRIQKYSLGSLVGYFNLDRGKAHRALDDSKATAEVYLRLIRHLGALPVSSRERIGQLLFGNKDVEIFRKALEPLVTETAPSAAVAVEQEQYYPDNVIGEAPEEKYGDYIEVDETAVENHFLKGGVFSRAMKNYEFRPMQAEMAVNVARAFNRSEFLMVEAATGVGKSIAYLLPAAWWASLNGERAVISTQTKNLQSQLFYKDTPQLIEAVGFRFKAALLKGRGNYICLFKYNELLAEAATTFNKADRSALASLSLWIENTRTGDISECNGFNPSANYYIWSRISCEGSFCLGQGCPFAKECFLLKIRREVASSQIIVINHHLTFADFSSGGDLIRDSGHIVFDEAHNLEKIAAGYLGGRFDRRALDGILADMYGSRPTQSGFLVNLKLAMKHAGEYNDESIGVVEKAIDSIIALEQVSASFFDKLSARIRELKINSDSREIRIDSENNPCEIPEREDLVSGFRNLSERLDTLIDFIRDDDSFPKRRESIARLESFAGDLNSFSITAADLLYAGDPEYVYWLDIPSSPRYSPALSSAPLEVGRLLDSKFYDYLKTAVFTSATMTVKGSFDYFAERLGLDLGSKERTLSLSLDSPFDIDSEVAVISAGFLPSPKNRIFEEEAFKTLEMVLQAGARKSMVLFTSYRSLKNAVEFLTEPLQSAGISLYSQQGSYNAERILRRFISSSKAVLFGTDTFWEGVDLPGELLELLVLFKLPFTVPDRPWFKANLEKIEADGQSSFAKLSLPDAVVKFRQGFGRLIRTAADRGCVVVLDSRVEKSSFGSHFTRSVRGTKHRTESPEDIVRIIKSWLNTANS